ncbi:hypothetical protein NHX12_027249 [Muraenolepis orangiensis]|uniref:Uncharacterized protein n=1 Tax=Muraenolepis orangiensis TaxID=630683 RepID=A0A9Q0INP0_9TELE|nr:hypothetical protein NHX12_027249 [Muraenolepis orangiensis]
MNNEVEPPVPITTLAGICGLTELWEHLPLPSPYPATTTRSFLYSARVSAAVLHLMAGHESDEKLVSQLAHGLSQVSTQDIELKQSGESDVPAEDMPELLQAVLSSHPDVFLGKGTGGAPPPSMPPVKEGKTYKRKRGAGELEEAEADQEDQDTSAQAVQKKAKRSEEKDVSPENTRRLRRQRSPEFPQEAGPEYTQEDSPVPTDQNVSPELLLDQERLEELSRESAKLKAMGITYKLPTDKLIKILNILEKNIQDGAKVSISPKYAEDGDGEDMDWGAFDDLAERISNSADACLVALHLMTSPGMPKAVYLEKVIERTLQYTRFHLRTTVYPHYDRGYREEPRGGSTPCPAGKRSKGTFRRWQEAAIAPVYDKLCDVFSNLSELMAIQLVTDTTVLEVTSMAMTPFFVENIAELQRRSITLMTAVFVRYEKHRQLILDEVFNSLARLPKSKRSLRHFR